jgi:hypothetical protein
MPTIFRWKGYRFHFYSDEGHERPHVHVRRAEDSAKLWLRPVSLVFNDGFSPTEVSEITAVVQEHRDEFEARWHEYFG